jgi:hypothetical protein
MSGRFIRVHNRMVHLDSIAYVDFLDSGRAGDAAGLAV